MFEWQPGFPPPPQNARTSDLRNPVSTRVTRAIRHVTGAFCAQRELTMKRGAGAILLGKCVPIALTQGDEQEKRDRITQR